MAGKPGLRTPDSEPWRTKLSKQVRNINGRTYFIRSPATLLAHTGLRDPAATDHHVTVVEDRGLSWRDSALGLVECGEDFVFASSFDQGSFGFVAMANLYRNPHRLAHVIDGDEIDAARA